MLFQTEKAALKPSRLIANVYDAMFLSGAVIGFGSALLFAGSMDKVNKAMLTTTGMAGLLAYTVNCKASEKVRKVDGALEKVQWDSMKYQLKEEEQVYQLAAEVEGSTRKVELIINKSNPWEWGHWAKRAGVVANMPPLQELTGETVEQPIAQHRTVETQEVSFEREIPDLPKKVAEDLRNTLIVGVPGSGKGLFISNCMTHVQDREDTTVFYLDPKNDPKESGYFKGKVDYLYRLEKGNIESSPEEIRQWLEDCLSEYESFKVTPGKPRKLLIIDELTGLMESLEELGSKDLKWFKRKINIYVASGDSRGITLWGIAQNGHNTGVGMDGGEKSQLVPIAIIYNKQVTASQGLQKADFIPGDQKLDSSSIKSICDESPIGRAIFHGGLNQWFPMPVLPNPSGYDRDKRKQVEVEPQDKSVETVVLEKPIKPLPWIEEQMTLWIQSLEELPSPTQVKEKWEFLSGKPLTSDQLKAVLKGLGLN